MKSSVSRLRKDGKTLPQTQIHSLGACKLLILSTGTDSFEQFAALQNPFSQPG